MACKAICANCRYYGNGPHKHECYFGTEEVTNCITGYTDYTSASCYERNNHGRCEDFNPFPPKPALPRNWFGMVRNGHYRWNVLNQAWKWECAVNPVW